MSETNLERISLQFDAKAVSKMMKTNDFLWHTKELFMKIFEVSKKTNEFLMKTK